ncbi:MAG: class I tRNA ligase family protein, partial [Gaiellaceae bacterium]
AFDFSHLVAELYRLTFDDFCDWYAEAVKQRLYDGDEDARATAVAALERLLKLLHPVMPHVTEEIWSSIPARETRLIVAPWPDAGDDARADALVAVQEAAKVFRRTGVQMELGSEAERRIFQSVVRPTLIELTPEEIEETIGFELARLSGEIARGEKMLANERFVANAKPEVVEAEREKLARYRRELDALSG